MAGFNLSLLRKNKVPLLSHFSQVPEDEMLGIIEKSLSDFLEQVLQDTPLKATYKNIENWRADKLSFVPRAGIEVSDIIKVYSIRKQLYLQYLPEFTQDIGLFSKIVLELEVFHQEVEKYAIETFVEIQQEALKQEKKLSESIINHSSNGIMAFDKDERIVLWNKTLEKRYGRKKEDVIGKKFLELYPELEGTEEGSYLSRAMQGEHVFIKDHPNPYRPGWYEADVIPLKENDEKVFGVVSIIHDITSWKESQLALKEQQEEILASNEELREKQDEINKAYEQLKEQQHFIEAVTDAVPSAIFIYDLIENRNIYTNNEISQVLGYTPDQILAFGSKLLDTLIHPDDKPLVRKREQEYLKMKAGDISELVYRGRNATGTYRSIRSKARIYKTTPDGKPWQVLGIIEDVTEKQRQDEELRQSRDYFLTILDDFPSLIWKANTEGLCDYFNKPWLKFTGRSYEEEYGNGWAEGVHPEDYDRCLDIFLSNFKARTAFQMEYRMKRHDGVYRWIIDHGKPIFDVKGTFNGFLGACFDIQERKDFEDQIQYKNEALTKTLDELNNTQEKLVEANETLEERVRQRTAQLAAGEKQLQLLTDALPTLISYVGKDEVYRFVNKTYSVWFGKAKEEIEGQQVREIIGEVVYQTMKPLIDQVLLGKEVKKEGKMDYKYGGSRHVSTNLIPHLENSEVKGFYALIYDVTEIRNAQQSLEKALSNITQTNQELTRINNDLDNFIYAASHDLKSPVINMEGILMLLKKSLTPKLDDKEKNLFQLLDNSVGKLKNAIAYLTDVTKISKNIDEDQEVIHIPTLIEEIKSNHQHLLEEVKPIIYLQLDVERIKFIKGNFYSILLNLFTNAIKFRSPERPLEIHISTRIEDGFIVLRVKDNGLGMSPEKQQNAFKLFKRMHAHVEGSGVGLYIVKRIAENCGGKVSLEGGEDEGVSFNIFFPLTFIHLEEKGLTAI